MRNRRSRLIVAVASLLAAPATAFAVVPTQGASVSLPGVRGIQTLEICTQVGGSPSCQKVATPNIRRGRISVKWNRGLGTGVVATPSLLPAQCNGRPGAQVRASVSHVATDITMSVKANYAGVSTQRTLISVRRTLHANQGATIWACLL
ncbi:MAG: hypothetical protein QOI80_2498 [Solirubrobacteraceae bacterium]|nr:hypothetical protein [Solirubrobacteraceae bacterium]